MNKNWLNLSLFIACAKSNTCFCAQAINKDKFNQFLFTDYDGFLVNEVKGISGLKLYRSKFLNRSLNPLKDLLALIDLCIYIRKNKINIVHTHSSKAGVLGRIAAKCVGVKIIVHTVHGWSFHNYQFKVIYWFCILIEKFCASFTNSIIVVSNFDKAKGLKYYIGNKDKYNLVRYGIDYSSFKSKDRRLDLRKKLGLKESDLAVGMISCFKPQKSPLDFIKLAREIKNAMPSSKFILVGDGVLRGAILRLIKKLKLNDEVLLTGWSQDVASILSALDIFVLTSLSEGLPIVVLEAFASSLPVVVSNTSGISEVVLNGKTGFLVKPKDIPAFAQSALKLLKDAHLREQIGLASFEYISKNNFTTKYMVNSIESIYENLLIGENV